MDVNGELMPKDSSFEPVFQQDGVHEKGKEKTFWMLCKDKRYRGKLFHSCWLSCSLFSVWLVETQPSATFLDLQIITRTNFEEASAFFTIHTVGFMIGCVLCAILSKKVKVNVLITFSLFAMGVSAIATPFCSSYLLMMGVRCLSGIFPGMAESVIYAEQMRIWRDEGKSVTQLVMLLASAGFFLAPAVSEPFLAAKLNQTTTGEELDDNATYTFDFKSETKQFNLSDRDNGYPNFSSEISNETHKITYPETNVVYAFLITGSLSILISVFFLLSSFFYTDQSETPVKVNVRSKLKYRSLPTPLNVGLILCICLFVTFIACAGISFAAFLMTFLVKEYDHITKSESAYILTLFYCCGSGIRIVLIFIADRITARNLLVFFIIVVFISFALFNIVATTGETIALVVLVGVMNIALAPDMPLMFSWCQAEYMDVSSLLSSCLTFSAALGVMINPLLLAYLMEHRDNMWFCYLLTFEAFISLILLIVMLLFNSCYVNRKYGPLKIPAHENEKEDCALSSSL